jgi:hypothetical protein
MFLQGCHVNYQTLDAIADAVNPVMGVVVLLFPWLRPPLRVQRALIMDLLTLAAVGLAYAVMAVDAAVGLWGRLGLDYSTTPPFISQSLLPCGSTVASGGFSDR